MRAIPKASKQIRGVANLLVGTNPHPVVYPERVVKGDTPDEVYNQQKKEAQEVAKKQTNWLTEELKDGEVEDKLVEMVINASKQSIAYLKITPDAVREKIIPVTRDGFDVYLYPMVKNIDDSPFVAEEVSVPIQEIWNNESYDERTRMAVIPDNQYSGSKIKDAYLRNKFGMSLQGSETGTVIKVEGFIREFLDKWNYNRISEQEDAQLVLEGKKMGDPIIRQIVCTRSGQVLYDHYTTLSIYPYAPFQFEPGYMYQVSQIERFIPANKSLDAVVSRLEGFLHTMVTGTWQKRKGEGMKISNQYGGQIVEYENTPLQPVQMAQVPQFVFQFVGLLNSFIEEQGLSVNTLAQIPTGVKAFRAIESLKESEQNNLQIPLKQMKKTVKRIADIYLQYADDYFTSPKDVPDQQSEGDYYQVIGQKAYNTRQKLNMPVEGMVPLRKGAKTNVEIENGAAFTEEGRKSQMLELITTLMPLFQSQALPPEFLKNMAIELVDTFKVGSLQEMVESLDTMPLTEQVTEADIEKIKLAMLQVMKDTAGGPDQGGGPDNQSPTETAKPPSESMSFKDLPPEGKVQMAAKAGIQLDVNNLQQQEIADQGGQNVS
jgi:hypothetical protein